MDDMTLTNAHNPRTANRSGCFVLYRGASVAVLGREGRSLGKTSPRNHLDFISWVIAT